MLFSSPDYPVFLIAVFFLYGLARWGGPPLQWARVAVMVLLADIVFMLVAKDPDALWDPIGGVLIRLAIGASWTPGMVVSWAVGTAVLAAALVGGRRYASWIASERGQAWIGRGLVAGLAAVGATVAIASRAGALDEVTAALAGHGHLVVLAVLGFGLGALQQSAYRTLGRVVVLFLASALFYHAWAAAMPGPYRYLLALLLATIVLDYYLALWIERTDDPVRRKALLVVSLCSNLGILGFFKYADFVSHDVLGLDVPYLHLILPAGISFHTFQSLSYTIDVYRRQLRATRSVIQFATFVLFFPQLVAGPIVRAHDLLPQLGQAGPFGGGGELPALELSAAQTGLFRIVIGLFKKIALADTLALAIVDRVFEAPERFSALEVAAGVYGYALQIYLDFSAYSDIAIGSAQVLGFTLPENFRTPYRAASLQEFWRRWHISLSTWLRDYLYVALGGSRGAPWRTYVNLLVTMVLGGLWHGASWAFVVWGALHGAGLAVTRYFQPSGGAAPGSPREGIPRTEAPSGGAAPGSPREGIPRTEAPSGGAAPGFPREEIPRTGAPSGGAGGRWIAGCAAIAVVGFAVHRAVLADAGVWWQLVMAWLYLIPLWAVLTAWLSRAQPVSPGPAAGAPLVADEGLPWRALFRRSPDPVIAGAGPRVVPERLRLAMCGAALGLFAALAWLPSALWFPLAGLTWGLGLAADAVEAGALTPAQLWGYARRALAALLVFHYVCLAWIFFRASSFDTALAVLRQLATFETDGANLVPVVRIALIAGAACHLFADGSFRWLRNRFVALPAWAQGALLAGAALMLRELGHTRIVPFIYFQF